MKKHFVACLVFLLSLSAFSQQKTNVGLLKGITSAVFAGMLENSSYEYTVFDSAEELLKSMKEGYIDAANVPTFLAEKILVHSGSRLCVPAVTSTTDVSLVSIDKNIHSFSDLLGKKVYVVKDSFEEDFFRKLLELSSVPVKNGETGVEIEYMDSFSTLVSALITKRIDCAVLSEPYTSSVLVNSFDAFSAVDFQDEYIKIYGSDKNVSKSVLLVLSQYRDTRRKDYSKFLEDVKLSVNFVRLQPVKSAGILKKKNLMLPASAAGHSLKNSHFVYKETDENFRLMLYN